MTRTAYSRGKLPRSGGIGFAETCLPPGPPKLISVHSDARYLIEYIVEVKGILLLNLLNSNRLKRAFQPVVRRSISKFKVGLKKISLRAPNQRLLGLCYPQPNPEMSHLFSQDHSRAYAV